MRIIEAFAPGCQPHHSPILAARSERRRAQRPSKDGPPSGHREAARSVLDGREHDGKMRWLGATHFAWFVLPESCTVDSKPSRDGLTSLTKSEASSPLGWALIARHALYSVDPLGIAP